MQQTLLPDTPDGVTQYRPVGFLQISEPVGNGAKASYWSPLAFVTTKARPWPLPLTPQRILIGQVILQQALNGWELFKMDFSLTSSVARQSPADEPTNPTRSGGAAGSWRCRG